MKMNNFLMMILAGALGAGLNSTFASKSLESTAMAQAVTEAIRTNSCSVRIGQQHITGRYRCDAGQVMTGSIQTNIYCSTITVDCANNTAAE